MSANPEEAQGISEDDYEDLVQRCARIQEIAHHPGWELLIDYVNIRRSAEQERIVFGSCHDWTDYRETVKFLEGIQFVLQTPAMVQNVVNELRQQIAEDRQADSEDDGA